MKKLILCPAVIILLLSFSANAQEYISGDIGETGETPRDTSPDFEKISKVDFPECENAKDRQAKKKCMERVYQELSKIGPVMGPALVPDLIKLAEQKKFPTPKGYKFDNEADKLLYQQFTCNIRGGAIRALGEIGDERAVDALLSVMDEKYNKKTACTFSWSYGDQSSICDDVSFALSKISPEGIADRLADGIEKSAPAYKKAVSRKNNLIHSKSTNLYKINKIIHEIDHPECYASVLSDLGPEGKSVIYERLEGGNLSGVEYELFLKALGKFKLNQEDMEFLKGFIDPGNTELKPEIRDAAINVLLKNPSPEYEDLYLYILENYPGKYYVSGPLKNIKSKKFLVIVGKDLEGSDRLESHNAARIMTKYDSEDVLPYLPVLISKVEGGDYDQHYLEAIGKANDPSTVNLLLEVAYLGESSALYAIGDIKSPESQKALETFISNDDYLKYGKNYHSEENFLMYRKAALELYLKQVGSEGVPFGMKHFDEEVVRYSLKSAIGPKRYKEVENEVFK